MNRFIGVLCLLILFNSTLCAQQGHYSLGARSMSMAHASLTIFDDFAAFNNIAGLAKTENHSLFFSCKNHYGLKGLFTIGTGYNSRLFSGVGSINFFRFGDQFFNEHKIGLGFSHKIRFISLGLQLNYIQLNMEGYGRRRWFVFEFGGIAEISKKTVIAAHIFNLNNTAFRNGISSLPVIIKGGISYRPIELLMFNIEYEHTSDQYSLIKIGMEYALKGKVFLRTGMVIGSNKPTFGIGFQPRKFYINYSVEIHPFLGYSQELSIRYKPNSK